MKGRKVTIELDSIDAAVVGATLRMLAVLNKSPDLEVAERLQRVGDACAKATPSDPASAVPA